MTNNTKVTTEPSYENNSILKLSEESNLMLAYLDGDKSMESLQIKNNISISGI